MTDKELEQKAEEYTNHLQSEMLVYCPENPRGRRTPTLLDVQEAYIAGAKDNGIVWHKVEDKLPPHDDDFIKNVSIPVMTDKDLWACYYPDEKEWFSNGMKIDVIAWCDFPGYKGRQF